MKLKHLVFFCLSLIQIETYATHKQESNILKPRIVVPTDVSTWETDDSESLARLLVHADMFEIEGIIYTTGWSLEESRDDFFQLIHIAIDTYEKDLPNLLKRSEQIGFNQNESQQTNWPSPNYLRQRTVFGSKQRGIDKIGKDNISDGSKLIIKLADENDECPLWILLWGSENSLAQAIWQVQQKRSEDDLKSFLHKIPTYAYTNHIGKANEICNKYEAYFYSATFNNFAARMDWAAYSKGNQNPVVIISGNSGIEPIYIGVKPGKEVSLDASKSYDPENDSLSFKWWIQPEAGTYKKEITIADKNSSKINIKISQDIRGKSFHVICEVTDNGEPNLTSYRRIIIQ
jgi:hypothetical protein